MPSLESESAIQERHDTPPAAEPVAKEAVKEVIKEAEKPLTDADKDRIFQDKLDANLTIARTRKSAQYEARLQEIVDFIKQKGTLVANQDIEEALKMSDTTATNRLKELIRRGRVARLGDQRHAKYKLSGGV